MEREPVDPLLELRERHPIVTAYHGHQVAVRREDVVVVASLRVVFPVTELAITRGDLLRKRGDAGQLAHLTIGRVRLLGSVLRSGPDSDHVIRWLDHYRLR